MNDDIGKKIEEAIEKDPALKDTIGKLDKIFGESPLSSQISMKLWAIVSLIKRHPENFQEEILTDIVFKASKALKIAHTVELLSMILKGVQEKEKLLSALPGEMVLNSVGALLETIHNTAAKESRPTLSQLDNLMRLATEKINFPLSETSESRPA